MRFFVLVATLLVLAPRIASSKMLYVDVVNGSDLPPGCSSTFTPECQCGGTPTAACKTITQATQPWMSQAGDTVSVAPGEYLAESGEAFPINVVGQSLVGAGSSSSAVEANARPAIRMIGGRLSGFFIMGEGSDATPLVAASGDVAIEDNDFYGAGTGIAYPGGGKVSVTRNGFTFLGSAGSVPSVPTADPSGLVAAALTFPAIRISGAAVGEIDDNDFLGTPAILVEGESRIEMRRNYIESFGSPNCNSNTPHGICAGVIVLDNASPIIADNLLQAYIEGSGIAEIGRAHV